MGSLGQPNLSVDSSLKSTNILRRYLDTPRLLDFLVNQTLYFSRADQFQDKFEGAFTQSTKSALELLVKSGTIDIPYNELKRRLRERTYINCWHDSKDDSMAMWQLYGQSNYSVALTTTVERLRMSLESHHKKYSMAIRRVKYVKHWRDPSLIIEPYWNVFTYKVKAYEYEQEVRIIIDRFAEGDHEIFGEGILLAVDINALVRSIVIAPEAPDWYVKLIREVAKQYSVNAPVRRSKLATNPV